MNVTQDILLPVLLAALLANTVIILFLAITTGNRRRERARVATSGAPARLDRPMLSSSYDDRRRDTWPTSITSVPLASAESESAVEPSTEPESSAAASEAGASEAGASETGESADEDAGQDVDQDADDGGIAEPDGEGSTAVRTPTFIDVSAGDAPRDGRDALTGLLDQATWGRILGEEDARIRRYHRPATIVLFELEGLERLVDRLGPDAAERVIPAVADTIRRLARDADRAARIGNGRFAVLLSETDEIAAINYIERVRRACELWLESGAIALHLIVGWAGTTGDPTLSEAHRIATDRMHAERRRGARRLGFEGSATA